MSEDFQTTAPVVQQTAAESATEQAIDAHLAGNAEKAAPLFNRASIEHRRSAPAEDGSTPADASDQAPALGQMPDAPMIAPTEVTAAIDKLNERSDGHSDLVTRWGSDFGTNLAYAKAGFAEIVATRPDLIAKFERNGLGDDVSVIEHLAQFGRQQAGRLGDFTIARNSERTTPAPFMPTFIPTARTNAGPSGNARGSEETKSALDRLIAENAPGSEGYKNPQVQARIAQLSRMIAGSGSPIGRSGRTS